MAMMMMKYENFGIAGDAKRIPALTEINRIRMKAALRKLAAEQIRMFGKIDDDFRIKFEERYGPELKKLNIGYIW